MASQVGVPLTEAMTYTLHQLIVMHDAKVLQHWDQTTAITQQLHTVIQVVATWGSRSKPKIKSWSELHPYRRDEKAVAKGRVTVENIDELKKRMFPSDAQPVPSTEDP